MTSRSSISTEEPLRLTIRNSRHLAATVCARTGKARGSSRYNLFQTTHEPANLFTTEKLQGAERERGSPAACLARCSASHLSELTCSLL